MGVCSFPGSCLFRHICATCQTKGHRARDCPDTSVVQNHQIVEQHIREETEAGRLLGPLPPQLAALCHISPMGLIPKTNQPGKWRLIVDLSTPQGASINDAIDSSHCSLHYASIEDAVQAVRHLGPGTLLAKLDLRKAYRVISVHPDDHALLGIKWESQVYIDTTLPFGLCSAPKIFQQWQTHWHGLSIAGEFAGNSTTWTTFSSSAHQDREVVPRLYE